jgi:hypothetical protein
VPWCSVAQISTAANVLSTTLIVFSYDDENRISKIVSKDITIEIVNSANNEPPQGIKYNGKVLSFDIYDKPATPKEIAAVELYYDFVRAGQLSVPTY